MNETFALYLYTRLDGLKTLLSVGQFVFIVGAGTLVVIAILTTGSTRDAGTHLLARRWLKPLTTAAALCSILQVVVPSRGDALFVIASTGVLEAAKSADVQRVAGKAAALVEKALDDYLEKGDKKRPL